MFGQAAFQHRPAFSTLEGADVLEQIVRGGIRRWNKSRISRDLQGGQLQNAQQYLRQLLWCTSINLVSSQDRVRRVRPINRSICRLRSSLTLKEFEFLAGSLDVPADVIPPRRFEVDAALYRSAIEAKNIAVGDDRTPPILVRGDTQFAFLVPERAFEDQDVLNTLVIRGVLSPKLGLCLLMVDFCNPVFSPARAKLLRYVPATIPAQADAFDALFIEAVRQANVAPPSPEAELLRLWDTQDMGEHVAQSLSAYHAAIQERLKTREGVQENSRSRRLPSGSIEVAQAHGIQRHPCEGADAAAASGDACRRVD